MMLHHFSVEEGDLPSLMKRKYEEESNDDFFDFSLSSPALKIRRLGAELAPMIREEETMKPKIFGQSMPLEDTFHEQSIEGSSPMIDELSSVPENEERAIVLFNPKNNMPLLQSPPHFSISVDSDFVSGFKNPVIWSNKSSAPKSLLDQTPKQHDDNSEPTDGCLAVVPWVSSNHSQDPPTAEAEVMETNETMDADAMDIEDDCNTKQIPKAEYGAIPNQWHQHCMIPQPPNNYLNPITWFGRG